MFSFKELLTEGRDAPLYHASQDYKAASIASEDTIQAKTEHPAHKLGKKPVSIWNPNVKGISLTRDLKLAQHFASRTWDNIVFQLDQRKLTQKYQIKPFQYWDLPNARFQHVDYENQEGGLHLGLTNEYEEFVIVPGYGIPLSKYCTKIYYGPKVGGQYLEIIKAYADKHGIPMQEF